MCKKLPDFKTRESKVLINFNKENIWRVKVFLQVETVRRELQLESQATEAWRRRNPIGRKVEGKYGDMVRFVIKNTFSEVEL